MSSLDLVCIWPPLLGLGSKFHQKYSIYLDQCSEMLMVMSGSRDMDTNTFSLLAIQTLCHIYSVASFISVNTSD